MATGIQLRRLRQVPFGDLASNAGLARTEAVAALLGTWLKLIRYASQFEGLPAVDAESFLSRARAEYTALGREQAVAAFRGSRGRRFELQVMDVLFAAADSSRPQPDPPGSGLPAGKDRGRAAYPWLDPLAGNSAVLRAQAR